MGRIQKGIMGGFSGTVGTVIGANWKGIDYMRSLPIINKNRKSSQKQVEQQAKFAVAIRFTRSLNDLFMETFDGFANRMTGANSALSDILKRAITGVYPAYGIVYGQVLVSRGSLPNAATATATSPTAGLLNFTWKNEVSGVGKAKPQDQVLLVAYCPELNRAVYRKGAIRQTLADTLDVSGFAGKEVQTWITFISEDGKDIADSLYTGQVLVV